MKKDNCSKCENKVERTDQRYCNACHAEYMRQHRPKYNELKPYQKKKLNARAYARVYETRGILKPQPCFVCQNPRVEKHHPDYDKPLVVEWLCRKHHLELHKC